MTRKEVGVLVGLAVVVGLSIFPAMSLLSQALNANPDFVRLVLKHYDQWVMDNIGELARAVIGFIKLYLPWFPLPHLGDHWLQIVALMWVYIGNDAAIDWKRGSGQASQARYQTHRERLSGTTWTLRALALAPFFLLSRWRSLATFGFGFPVALFTGAAVGSVHDPALMVGMVAAGFTIYEAIRAHLGAVTRDGGETYRYRFGHLLRRFAVSDFLIGLGFVLVAMVVPSGPRDISTGILLSVGFILAMGLRNIVSSILYVQRKVPGDYAAKRAAFDALYTPKLGFAPWVTFGGAAVLITLAALWDHVVNGLGI